MSFDPSSYKTVSCNGFQMAYQRSGSGTPVLMVHGITTYSFIWRKLVPLLEDDYDLVRVDLLGCGSSDMSADYDLSLKNHAALLIEFMNQLGLEKVHLVGHDIGGGIVQIMGINHPERFHSIVMMNPVGYDYWPVQPITSMRTPVFRQLAMAAFDRGYYKSIVRKATFRNSTYTDELNELFWSNFDNPRSKKSFLRFAKCLNNNDLMEISDQLKHIDLPVMILRAEKDVFLSSGITSRLNEDIPGSTLKIIPKSGHYIQEDAPEEITIELKNFWKF